MRLLNGLVLAWLLLLAATPAWGQAIEAATQDKIDVAINFHYLNANFGKAEQGLADAAEACGTQCRPATLARVWMYLGLVRGSGRGDQSAAREAFDKALQTDRGVAIDEALATPETLRTFEEAQQAAGSASTSIPPAASPSAPSAEAPPAPSAPTGALECNPAGGSVQTRRPIPVACQASALSTGMSVRYKAHGGDWQNLTMTRVGAEFQATIPCEATQTAGVLSYYVFATDAAGDPVDTFGSKSAPATLQLGPNVADPPPAFTGKPPPDRCPAAVEKALCPPDFPGCEDASSDDGSRGDSDWGAKCDNSGECRKGLLCLDGTCESAPTCQTDSDCPTGVCLAGQCDIPASERRSASAPYRTSWLGLHVGYDIGLVGGDDVCTTFNQDFDCFRSGSSNPYPGLLPVGFDPSNPGAAVPGDPYPGTGIASGLAGATVRVLLSYDFAFASHFTVGVRGGYAFGGGPPNADGSKFFPIHAEGRLGYWFTGLSGTGFRPYVNIGGGIAQVDVKSSVTARDCSQQPTFDEFLDCIEAAGAFDSALDPQLPNAELDVFRRLGRSFVTVGGGVVYAFSDNIGLQINLNGMYLLSSTGIVLEPSLGFVYGL